MKIVWKKEGSGCLVRGCNHPRRGDIFENMLLENSAQGGWACAAGHTGWVWPNECRADSGTPSPPRRGWEPALEGK